MGNKGEKMKDKDSFMVVEGQLVDVITWDEEGNEIKGKMYLDDLLAPLDALAKENKKGK